MIEACKTEKAAQDIINSHVNSQAVSKSSCPSY